MITDPTPPSTASGGGLQPCPFCGSSDIDPSEWLRNDGVSGPGCESCGASASSAAGWNRRALAATSTDAAAGWADTAALWKDKSAPEPLRSLTYYIGNPSAWEDYDEKLSKVIERALDYALPRMSALPSAGEAETGSGDPGRAAELTSAWRDYCRTRYGEHQPKSSVTAHFAAGFNSALAPPTAPPAPPVVEAGGDELRDWRDDLLAFWKIKACGAFNPRDLETLALWAQEFALTTPPPAPVAQAEEALATSVLAAAREAYVRATGGTGPVNTPALKAAIIASARASRVAGAEAALDKFHPQAVAAYADVVAAGDRIGRSLENDVSDRRAVLAFVDRFRASTALARPSAAGTEGVES